MLKIVFGFLCATLVFTCSGCALLPLSVVGSIVALGNSSVSQGRETYFWGKLQSAEMSRFDTARAAVKSAAADLGLQPKLTEKLTLNRSEMGFVDDCGTPIGIRIDRLSDNLIHLRVDVGAFGSEVTDRLFLARVRAHLPNPSPVVGT